MFNKYTPIHTHTPTYICTCVSTHTHTQSCAHARSFFLLLFLHKEIHNCFTNTTKSRCTCMQTEKHVCKQRSMFMNRHKKKKGRKKNMHTLIHFSRTQATHTHWPWFLEHPLPDPLSWCSSAAMWQSHVPESGTSHTCNTHTNSETHHHYSTYTHTHTYKLTPSMLQPVKLPGCKLHPHACKQSIFQSYNKSNFNLMLMRKRKQKGLRISTFALLLILFKWHGSDRVKQSNTS